VKQLRRLSLLLAALAVLVMSTAYVAHRHKQDLANDAPTADHCELCLQVGRSAGPLVVTPAVVGASPGWTLWFAVTGLLAVLPQALRRAQQARAPPR
jgi:hypothetical protein